MNRIFANYITSFGIGDKWLRLLSYLIVIAAVFYRRPDAFYDPQMWGDEGSHFLADAYNFGFESIAFTCNGYFHVFPRFIAWCCVFIELPLHLVPFVFTYIWFFVLMLLVHFVWEKIPLSKQQLFYLVISIMLIPLQSEIVMNLTNLQWLLSLFPLIIFSFPEKSNKPALIRDFIIIVLAGLTGPNFTVLLPLFVIQFMGGIRRKNLSLGYRAMFVAGLVLGLTGAFALFANNAFIRSGTAAYFTGTGILHYLFVQYTFMFIGAYCTDFSITAMTAGALIIVGVFVYALLTAYNDKANRFKLYVLLFGCLFLVSVIITYSNEAEHLNPYYYSPRNFFLPALAFVWLIVMYSEKWPYRSVLRAGFMIWMAVQTHWYVGPYIMEDLHLEEYSEKVKTSDTLRVPIHPQGWSIFLDKRSAKP